MVEVVLEGVEMDGVIGEVERQRAAMKSIYTINRTMNNGD